HRESMSAAAHMLSRCSFRVFSPCPGPAKAWHTMAPASTLRYCQNARHGLSRRPGRFIVADRHAWLYTLRRRKITRKGVTMSRLRALAIAGGILLIVLVA